MALLLPGAPLPVGLRDRLHHGLQLPRGHRVAPDRLPDRLPDLDVVRHRVDVDPPVQGPDRVRLLSNVSPVCQSSTNPKSTDGEKGKKGGGELTWCSGYRCYAPYTCISTPSLSAIMTGDMTQGCPETPIKTRTTSTFVISSKMWPFVYAPQVVLIQGNDTSTTGAAAASSPSGPSTTSSASRDGDAQAGLSTAAKAAIGTAVPLIFIALALAAYIFYRRRNRSKARAEAASEQGSGFPGMNKPELDATPSPFALSLGPGSELDGTPRPSPPGDDSTTAGGRVSELPGPGVARFLGPMCELPGDEKFARRLAQPKGSDAVAADDEGGKIGPGASINGASEPKAYDTKEMDAEKSSRGGKDK